MSRPRARNRRSVRAPAHVANVFHSAQPRPRVQVSSSTDRPLRNTVRLSPVSNVQATARSHAGSPTPHVPKSMTDDEHAVVHEQVALRDVAVEPHGLPLPATTATRPARSPARLGTAVTSERLERGLRQLVVCRQRPAPVPVVQTRTRAVGGIDPLQSGEEVRECRTELRQVGDVVPARGVAVEPSVHRPRVRIPLTGCALGHRNRDRQWKLGGQHRQPALFLLDGERVRRRAGQSDRHLCTEMERPVVPALVRDRQDGQVGPLRELRGHQTPHQLLGSGIRVGTGPRSGTPLICTPLPD